jgi:hypothetical protein
MSNTIDPKEWDKFNRAYYRRGRVQQRVKQQAERTEEQRKQALEKIREIRARLVTSN